MSLHRKIIAWFVIFAALTISVFGLGDYIQSARALRFALETRAGSVALQVASAVERRHDRIEAELLALGHAAAAGGLRAMPEPHNHYAHIEVLRAGVPVFSAKGFGSEARDVTGCARGDVAFVIDFTSARGVPYAVRARMASAEFYGGVSALDVRMGHGLTVIVDDGGTVVFDPGCALTAAGGRDGVATEIAAAVIGQSEDPPGLVRTTSLSARTGDLLLLTARTGAAPSLHAAVTVDYAEFAAPFIASRRQYIGGMTAILVAALLLGLAGIRSDMRRLQGISQAADAIGHGRFDVWLPPPAGDEIGRVSLALGRMTERLSSSLRQIEVSRSMAAVGELATYLSHEIRNPLSSIRLNLQMLGRDIRKGTVPDDGELLVGLCLSELQRLDDVVRAVLEVGRPARDASGTCTADQVVEETLHVIQRKLLERGVLIELKLGAQHSTVRMDAAALRGVVLNLVLNGVDALAGTHEPRMHVTTRLLADFGDTPCFELRVIDNGPGVPAHLRDRIFDPFFTTKSKGNGIGLATALHAVQECGGVLRCEPAHWGGGAEFVVELPLGEAREPIAGVKAQPRRLVAAAGVA